MPAGERKGEREIKMNSGEGAGLVVESRERERERERERGKKRGFYVCGWYDMI